MLADNRASTVVTIERRVIADRDDRGASGCATSRRCSASPADDLLGRTWLCGEPGAPAAPACWAGSPQVPVPLADDVDPTRALSLVEQPDRFPGVAVESRPVRVYPRPQGISAAQALGYLGQVRAEEVGAAVAWSPTTSWAARGWSSSTTPCCAGCRAAPSSPSTRAGW